MTNRTLFPFLLVLVLAANLAVAAERSLTVFVNGEPIKDVLPLVIEGKAFLPALPAAKALGGKAEWQSKGGLLVICRGDICLPLAVEKRGEAREVKGQVYLSARKLAELFEWDWSYDAKQRVVSLTAPKAARKV